MEIPDTIYHPAQSRGLHIAMPPHPIAAEQARTLAAMILDDWDLEILKDDALLVISELVTNAAKQHDVFWFTFRRAGDSAVIEVTDTSLGNAKIRNAAETDTNGRGLLIVQAVSDTWDVRYEEDGRKTVWATISK